MQEAAHATPITYNHLIAFIKKSQDLLKQYFKAKKYKINTFFIKIRVRYKNIILTITSEENSTFQKLCSSFITKRK